MATAPTEAGQITVGKMTLAQPYIGVDPLGISSPDREDQEAKVTLNGGEDQVVYLSGLIVTGSGATAAQVVEVTVMGLAGGPRRFFYGFEEGVDKINQPLVLSFVPPLKGGGPGAGVSVTCPPSGEGGLHNSVMAWGFASSDGD